MNRAEPKREFSKEQCRVDKMARKWKDIRKGGTLGRFSRKR